MLSPGPPDVRQISRESILHTSDTAMKVSLNEENQAMKDVVFFSNSQGRKPLRVWAETLTDLGKCQKSISGE